MSWNKIFVKLKAFISNKKFFPKNIRFNILAFNPDFPLGFYFKIFTLNSSYFENTVGVILSAQYFMIFYLDQASVII